MSKVLVPGGAVLIAVVMASGLAESMSRWSNLRPSGSPQDPQSIGAQEREAYRAGGLAAAAAVDGSYIGRVAYPNRGGPATLGELANLSHLIIIGIATGNVCLPTADGRSIVTFYSVRANQILKGPMGEPGPFTIVILGGRVGFPDGSWAQLNASNFAIPENGERAVWFLRAAPQKLIEGNEGRIVGPGAFVPTSGPLGFYDLTRNGRARPYIQPAGSFTNPLAQRIHRARLLPDAFVMEVKRALVR